jgi:hypothetical protein
MLIGMGDLGGILLEYLVTIPNLSFVIADINEDRALARVNLARLGAVARGLDPQIDFVRLDLADIDGTADAIAKVNPAIILTTATLQTWWLPDRLPAAESEKIKSAGFGVWFPVHFALTLNLMHAVQRAAFSGFVVTAPYPDVANAVLGKLGMPPTCGIGNVEEIVPKIRWLAAQRLSLPIEAIKVTLVAHHALQRFTLNRTAAESVTSAPFFLKVEAAGHNVTEEVSADQMLLSGFPITAGPTSHVLTAATTHRLVNALVGETERYIHVPGPNGLPGGYPTYASSRGIRLANIPELSPVEAIRINEDSHRFDGIEKIEEDGSVRFTEPAVQTMREALGYDCSILRPEEVTDRSRELVRRFAECADRLGVKL